MALPLATRRRLNHTNSKAAGKAKATESYGDLPSEAGDGAGKRKERKGSEKSASEAGHKAGTAEERASFEASAKDGGAADEATATKSHEESSVASFSRSIGDGTAAGNAKATESHKHLPSEAGDGAGKRKETKGSEKSASRPRRQKHTKKCQRLAMVLARYGRRQLLKRKPMMQTRSKVVFLMESMTQERKMRRAAPPLRVNIGRLRRYLQLPQLYSRLVNHLTAATILLTIKQKVDLLIHFHFNRSP
eukprot:TRINITY_DN1407_c0_g1_i4.p1 TRINITY_DN1407_c0_g1~~TRINITY_DN1407_c0_g1_i4.p1  ORF type:complete len:248 (-),score=42.17 TRINITY_DN1407_c0_g1_i4:306-1049(-)